MNWFTGPITSAILESQTKKLIFLVYTYDSKSSQVDELWNDETIFSLCNENCVCLKLEAESEPCNQFKQLYPISDFPTTYFIGNSGAPIESVSGIVDKEVLEARIQIAIKVHKTPLSQVTEASTSSAGASSVSQESEQDQKKKLDERVALAKEKLKQLQEKKRLEEEEREKQREIERRKIGQEMIKSKNDREEQEMKRIAEQKKQEKIDDMLAKQKIKERIQQDREEKQKKYAQEKETLDQQKEEARIKQEQVKQQEKLNEAANKSQSARIQFRLVDGSSIMNQFDPSQTLGDAKKFIANKLKEMNETQSFSMHSTFPKRDYTENDMSQTLRDLQLAPSATILVIPIRSKASKVMSNFMPTSASSSSSSTNSTSSNSLVTYASDFFGIIMLPFTIIWGLISNFIGVGTGGGASSSNLHRQNSSNRNIPPVSDNIRIRNSRRNLGTPTNVRSLHQNDADRDDDENATWNGNSTQQM